METNFVAVCPGCMGTGPHWPTCQARAVTQQPYFALQGWECPRCHMIHAPHVAWCGCAPLTFTRTDGGQP